MPKIPNDPKEIFNEITKDYQDIYGKNLVSIILYGSAASGSYIPKKSDINFLIVLTEEGIQLVNEALEVIVELPGSRQEVFGQVSRHTTGSHVVAHHPRATSHLEEI